MSNPIGGITTTCVKCGSPSIVFPPSPDYPKLLLKPCPEGGSIERPFKCGNRDCGEINKIHWDINHVIDVTSAPKYDPSEPYMSRF
jgi:hypothetical protein